MNGLVLFLLFHDLNMEARVVISASSFYGLSVRLAVRWIIPGSEVKFPVAKWNMESNGLCVCFYVLCRASWFL